MDINVTVAAIKRELRLAERPVPAVLQDRFTGVSALVVSAGPSAKQWRSVFESMPEPALIVCVKQGVELQGLSDLCHLHFCNTWNLRNYNYDSTRVLRLFSSADEDPPSYQSWDVNFRIDRGNGGLETCLAAKQNFEAWTLSQSGINRPWGPGIIYETVIYTLIHMGVRSISTVGWDIADPAGSNTHFYDTHYQENFKLSKYTLRKAVRSVAPRAGASKIAQLYRFISGAKYNPAGTLQGEAALVATSVPVFFKWLAASGVTIHCHTNSPWLAKVAEPIVPASPTTSK